jgi:hypothetical protein
LSDVARKDILLTEVATKVHQHQLEKAVLLERVLRIAEELAYEDMKSSRKKAFIG